MKRREDWNDAKKKRVRQRTHLVFAFIFLLFVLLFKWVNDPSMIGVILKVATYTYGPLLGLFSFGIITKRKVIETAVPFVCIASPVICFILDKFQKEIFGAYQIGLELLIINGLLTFTGLLLFSKPANETID